MTHVVLTALRPAVALLTIRRTDNERNQINPALMESLEAALRQADAASPRALVVQSGYEKLFSTGADIEALGGANAQQAEEFSRHGKAVFGLLQQLPCVTICALNGFALGGGLELALHCDLRLCTANARLGLPEINLGIIPGWGGTQLLPGAVGRSRALRMILSGEPVNAETALACGLVDEVVPAYADLLPAAEKLAARFADKPRGALGKAKAAVYGGTGALACGNSSQQVPTSTQPNSSSIEGTAVPGKATGAGACATIDRDIESPLFAAAWDSAERIEGVAALIGKRRPVWPE